MTCEFPQQNSATYINGAPATRCTLLGSMILSFFNWKLQKVAFIEHRIFFLPWKCHNFAIYIQIHHNHSHLVLDKELEDPICYDYPSKILLSWLQIWKKLPQYKLQSNDGPDLMLRIWKWNLLLTMLLAISIKHFGAKM